MPSLELKLAIQGRLRETIAANEAAAARGYTSGIRIATEELKLALRQDVVQAGLGPRLSNTWRSRVYPQAGNSLGAAGFVWTKAPHIMQAHEGATIRSADGFYLAIPTDAVPKRVLGQRVTPGAIERAWGIKLRLIPGGGRSGRSGRPSLLVADVRQRRDRRGGFAAPNAIAKRPQKLVTVPLFILLPQVRLRRRLSIDATYTQIAGNLAATVAAAMEAEFSAIDGA